MKPASVLGGSWPTPQQELLLRTALLPDDNALSAWEEWKAGANIEDIDPGSYRLLPLVYRNLKNRWTGDALAGKLKGTWRQTWYKNQLAFREFGMLLNAFQAAGIDTLILKGAALCILCYKDLGLRPMQDLDLLVKLKDKDKALQLMQALGWQLNIKAPHGWSFKNGAGLEIDLHWHALAQCCQEHDDDDFWAGAVPVQVAGVSTRALNPTDQLLQVCVHGVAWNEIPPIRWIADAVVILNSQSIDWSRLVEQARRHALILTLRESLSYLCKLANAPIPANFMREINEATVTRSEQWDYAARICRPEDWTLFYAFWTYSREYVRSVEGKNIFRKLFGYPEFLRYLWKLDHLWQVPFYGVWGALKRSGRTIRPTP